MHSGIVGIEAESSLILVGCAIQIALAVQAQANVDVSVGVLGVEAKRDLGLGQGPVPIAFFTKGKAEIEMSVGVVRVDLQRTLKFLDRGIEVMVGAKHVGQRVMCLCITVGDAE